MQTEDYLRLLVEDIHSAVLATLDGEGHPQTRVIDMMLWDAQGEYFDIRDPAHVARDSFAIGGKLQAVGGYVIGSACIGCKRCLSVCPQRCIDGASIPAVIDPHHCLHCGRCAEICPVGAVEKRF